MKISSNKIVVGLLVAMTLSSIGETQAQGRVDDSAVYVKNTAKESTKEKDAKPTRKEILEKYRNKKNLTDEQLVELLRAVGFKGKELKEAYGIAKRESNGRPRAFNGNKSTGDHSYGIFQINMIGDLGVARREKFNLKSNAELYDPVTNAQIAYHMSQGGKNWSAWKGVTPRAVTYMKQFPN